MDTADSGAYILPPPVISSLDERTADVTSSDREAVERLTRQGDTTVVKGDDRQAPRR